MNLFDQALAVAEKLSESNSKASAALSGIASSMATAGAKAEDSKLIYQALAVVEKFFQSH